MPSDPVTTERIAALAEQLLEDNRDLTFAQISRLALYAAAWMMGQWDEATDAEIDKTIPSMIRFCTAHAKAALQAKIAKGRIQ